MLKQIKEFFQGEATSLDVDKSGEPTNKDLQVATGVLLLEMAGADEDFAPEEVRAIFSTMEEQFNIKDMETLEIMESAESLRQEQGKIDEFIKTLNQSFDDRQKQLLLAMVWKVVIADQLIDKYEERFANQLRLRLQLTEEQAEEAKKLAESGRI